MKIQIDQSGKIEDTSQDTVVAFSNSRNKSVLLRAKDKRELQALFRDSGRSRVFVYKTFASLIYTLIRNDLGKIDEIIIDREYKGHEVDIKRYLLQIIRKSGNDFPKENIRFEQIGKKANAHKIAYKVYCKKEKADIVVSLRQLKRNVLRGY